MPDVFIAGATEKRGRYLCAEYHKCGRHVRAVVRVSIRPQFLSGTMDRVASLFLR